MAEAKLVGMFLESKCDVCGKVLNKLPNNKKPYNFEMNPYK